MATEVRMLTDTWCDVHLLKDPQNTERVESVWSGVVTIDKLRRSLDLCEPCRAEFIGDLPEVLEKFGTKLDPAAAVKATKDARPSQVPDGKDHTCPRCDMNFASRSGLTQHARNVHGKALSVLEAELGLPASQGQRKTPGGLVDCPVCNQQIMGAAGLGSHMRTHKNDPKAQPSLLKTG